MAEQRDTNTWYLDKDPFSLVSNNIIDLIRKHAGKKILDFGCGTGGYCARLNELGFECAGIDQNEEYVKMAKSIGVNASVQKGNRIEFPDSYFDTAIMVEVIEHLKDPGTVLEEIKRVIKNNVIITCPNNTESRLLGNLGLTFEHMLDADHKQFFTVNSLKALLQKHFQSFSVLEKEPISSFFTFINFGIIRPRFFFRLYAEAKK